MKTETAEYKGLPQLLHIVRWSQHLLAIIAEILILLSFAMSGMDANLGGIMTAIPALKWLWAAMFALGIDAMFVISWVRVRQSFVSHNWSSLFWNGILALGMSFIVFQPVAIQLLQQSLAISFNQALSLLGINIVILTYARSIVAVFLGAVLALSNVEQATKQKNDELFSHQAVLENMPKEDTPVYPQQDTHVDTEQDTPEYTDEAGAPKREIIEAALMRAVASNKKPNLSAVSRELKVSYPYVKKVWAHMKERHTDGIRALQIVK